MRKRTYEMPNGAKHHAGERWSDSSTLYLLNCYDIWSATPRPACTWGTIPGGTDVEQAPIR